MADDEDTLLRLVWNPRDFDKGNLKATAFGRADLIPLNDSEGHPRYVSMDIQRLLSKRSVDWNIGRAQTAGKGAEKERRVEPKFANFSCLALRSLTMDSGSLAFEVMDVPLPENADGPGSPQNDAHVGVRSATPDPMDEEAQNLKVEELRTLLKLSCLGISTYEDEFEV